MFHKAIGCALMLLSVSSAATAHEIAIDGCAGPIGLPGQTTGYAGIGVDDFNEGVLPATVTGVGGVQHGTTPRRANPAGDATDHSVAARRGIGSGDIALAQRANHVGHPWGSIDNDNEVDCYRLSERVGGANGQGVRLARVPEPGSVERLGLCLVGAFATRRTHRG